MSNVSFKVTKIMNNKTWYFAGFRNGDIQLTQDSEYAFMFNTSTESITLANTVAQTIEGVVQGTHTMQSEVPTHYC